MRCCASWRWLNNVHDVFVVMVDAAFAFELPNVSAGWIEAFDVETGSTRLMSRREARSLQATASGLAGRCGEAGAERRTSTCCGSASTRRSSTSRCSSGCTNAACAGKEVNRNLNVEL